MSDQDQKKAKFLAFMEKLMQRDPELAAGMNNPEIKNAITSMSSNPNDPALKDPEVAKFMEKFERKLSGMMGGGMMGGGMVGHNSGKSPPQPPSSSSTLHGEIFDEETLKSMKISKLKELIEKKKLNLTGLVEKSELVKLLLDDAKNAKVASVEPVEPGYQGGQNAYGYPDGQGIVRYDDGASYEGDFVDGNFHGKGVFRFANGASSTGDWENNMMTKGIYIYANGNRYEGDFKDGKKNGFGEFRSIDGSSYVGDWVDDKNHGRGTYVYPDKKSSYEGDWVDDEFNGRGTYVYPDGDRYTGDYRANKRHGKGVLSFANGGNYDGDFVDDKMHGHGAMHSANGNIYKGEFVDDRMSGKAVYSWPNGNVFEGDFTTEKMTTGHMYLKDDDLKLKAVFSGGDDIVEGYKLYYLVLTKEDGSVYREGGFSRGKFV